MLETIAIFDEFSQPPDELTDELRHKKRMALDPLIYDMLKHKYGATLEAFWKQHRVPVEASSWCVIVERRIHPNLAFLLYSTAYFAQSWGIVLICSDLNYEYCKAICGHNAERVRIVPWFHGNPEPSLGKREYNDLLKSADFYRSLPGEHLFFMEMDGYLRKPIPTEWLDYDLVAAPYEWDESSGGGGVSFRNRSAMIQICEQFHEDIWAQDTFLWKGAKTLGFRIPPFELAVPWIAESCLYEDPVAVHQWWTFFFPKQIDDAEEIFHSLLSLEIE